MKQLRISLQNTQAAYAAQYKNKQTNKQTKATQSKRGQNSNRNISPKTYR